MPGTRPGMTAVQDAAGDPPVEKLSRLIKGPDLLVAPVALNPIMAQMAALAGFKAAYLSGGSLGWYKGVTEAGLSLTEMVQMGYRLAASSGTAFAAMVKAVRQSYECRAQDTMDPFAGPGGAEKEMKAAHQVTGLDRLLEIERRTMKGLEAPDS